MPTRQELEALLQTIVPDAQMRALGLDIRNRGGVEKAVVGPASASGRVKGKRNDGGFNVRVTYAPPSSSCGCPLGKKRKPCEHIAAFILGAISLLPPDSAVVDESRPVEPFVVKAKAVQQPDPEVYRFLLDLFPGIGPKRAREVARVFRNIPDLLQATERQLQALPEIGVWASSALRERLQEYTRLTPGAGGARRASGPRALDDAPDKPQPIAPMPEWLKEMSSAPAAGEDAPGLARLPDAPLTGVRILIQATRAGPVFWRPDNPRNPLVRRVLKRLQQHDPAGLRASKRGVWVSGPDDFARTIGRLEALGFQRESGHKLVDLPLDGLAVFVDASGRRARFQVQQDGVEEAYPQFLSILRACEGYEFDDVNGHHLVLPRDYPRLRNTFSEMGALLVRRRLRPVREITAFKEPSLEEYQPGTPRKREAPDLTPYLTKIERPPGLRAHVQPYPYQWEGVAFIRATDYVAYIADQPGLGKTLQAIVSSLYLPGRILVVCPAGARNVWKKEIANVTTHQCAVIQSQQAAKLAKGEYDACKYIVVSYDALLTQREHLLKLAYDMVILDEAHYVKNKEAERTKAVHEALGAIPRRLLLSGTPVMNRPEEARKQIEFLYPDEWGNEPWFRAHFVQPLQHGTPLVRKLALQSLRHYFDGIMLRRRKVDVLKDLPPRHVLIERVKLPPVWRKEYDAEAALLQEHVRRNRDTAFGIDYDTTRGHIMTLRQVASNGKSEAAEQYIRKLLTVPGEKVVVFSVYLTHLEQLKKALADYNPVEVTGAVNDKQRALAVKRFQEDDECRAFLGQIIAAGTALTLTAARHVVFIDLDWNPANHEQAGDRVHRIGQTRDCFMHYLVAGNTIDDDVAKLLDLKVQDTSLLLDNDEEVAGLLAQRRQSRIIAQVALSAAMGEGEAAEKERAQPA